MCAPLAVDLHVQVVVVVGAGGVVDATDGSVAGRLEETSPEVSDASAVLTREDPQSRRQRRR